MKVKDLITEVEQLDEANITLIAKRFYKVGFKDKEKAKEQGLKWDSEAKKWYFPIYNTSGKTSKDKIVLLDKEFDFDKEESTVKEKENTDSISKADKAKAIEILKDKIGDKWSEDLGKKIDFKTTDYGLTLRVPDGRYDSYYSVNLTSGKANYLGNGD